MVEAATAPRDAPRGVRILHVGGSAAQADRLRATLAQSRTLACALVHVERVADVAEHPDA